MQVPVANSKLSFGLFEVDVQTGELWKAGFRVKLQGQPFKVLVALLERPGQIVTRDELQMRLWGKDTVVDFDHSLGTAINKIREALGDSADNPRFVETLARRGYRFIAPVTVTAEAEVPLAGGLTPVSVVAEEPVLRADVAEPTRVVSGGAGIRHMARVWAICFLVVLLVVAAGIYLMSVHSASSPPHISKITQNGHLATSLANMENLAASVTDGVHLFSPVIDNGQAAVAVISLTGGTVVRLNTPPEIASPALGDISPDGSRLLLREHLSPESEQPLWVVPTIGGPAQRVGNTLAHEATWMPDGNGILYANGNELYVTHLTGNNPEMFARLPGRAFWLRWEPRGQLLRFTIIDPIAHTLSLWQLSAADRKPVQILNGFNSPAGECCGVWTADGSSFVFQSSRGGNSDLWKLKGEATKDAVRLTDGPLQFQSPVAARNGDRVYFLGVDARSELQRLTPKGLVPENGFLAAAIRVEYSRDGKSVAWSDNAGHLWRAKADGTDQSQLTPDNLDVFLARWSPDGGRLALMAREPGKAWQIYLIGADGNDLRLALQESRNSADPSWSPDGQSLVFGRINDVMGKENATRGLLMLDLRTGKVAAVAGSEDLFSPRWSPDGRYIAALSLDQRKVRLLDVATKGWSTLPVPSGADPVWSSDSRFLYLHASLDPAQPIDRISIPDGRVQELVRLAESVDNNAVDYVFGGLTVDNMPLIRTRVFTGNVYSLSLKEH